MMRLLPVPTSKWWERGGSGGFSNCKTYAKNFLINLLNFSKNFVLKFFLPINIYLESISYMIYLIQYIVYWLERSAMYWGYP